MSLPPNPEPRKRTAAVAIWAGLTALFANIAALNVLSLLGDESNQGYKLIAAAVTALTVAGGIFARQRWEDAKAERKDQGLE